MPTIRYAKLSDAPRLAVLAEETFRDTFGSVNTADDMAAYCQTNYSEAKQSEEISDAGTVTLVCEDGEQLVAFAQLRWTELPSCISAERPGEIQRLYVAKSWHGRGMAQELMASCIEEIEKRGSDAVWLGVWEDNSRAIAFYKKAGFVEVGSHPFLLGTDRQRDIIMLRLLPTVSVPLHDALR